MKSTPGPASGGNLNPHPVPPSRPPSPFSKLFSDDVEVQISAAKMLSDSRTVFSLGVDATNVVLRLLHLIKTDHPAVRNASFDALANLISSFCFDIAAVVLEYLPRLFADAEFAEVPRLAGKLLERTSARIQTPTDWKAYKPLLPLMRNLLESTEDESILCSVCQSYSIISGGPQENVQEVADSGVIPGLMNAIKNRTDSVSHPCRRTLGNFIFHETQHLQVMVDLGLYPILLSTLLSGDPDEVKEACWILSNVFTESPSYVSAAIDIGIMRVIVEGFGSRNFKARDETCWALLNATDQLRPLYPEQIQYLVSIGTLEVVALQMSSSNSSRSGQILFEGIGNIFATCPTSSHDDGHLNLYAMEFESLGGVDVVAMRERDGAAAVVLAAEKFISLYYT